MHSHPLRALAHCVLCIVYSEFTHGECLRILSAVAYCVFMRIAYWGRSISFRGRLRIAYCVLRIAYWGIYWGLHFESGCVLRIAYCVLGAPILRAVAYCVLRIAYCHRHRLD